MNNNNNNILEELNEVYKSYKKGEYTFGKYATGEQIEKAFLDGKIFVLNGTKKIFLICISVPIVAAILFFFFQVEEDLFIPILIMKSIVISFLGFFVIILCFTVIRWFVVIGPSGVYLHMI